MESKYTDYYLKNDAGKRYDGVVNNRFELFIGTLESHCMKQAIQKAFPAKKPSHLDFACGTGRILEFLQDAAASQTGIDTSAEMIREARKKVRARFIQANILKKNPLKKPWGLITSFRLFINIEDEHRQPILTTLRSHLKNDGLLIVNNHMNRYSFIGMYYFLKKLFGAKYMKDGGSTMPTMSEWTFKKHLKNAGFTILKVHRLALLPGRRNLILLPEKALFRLELIISRIPVLRFFCKDQIYICAK